jgi:hypothetical protein
MGSDAASTKPGIKRLQEHLRREAADGEYYFKSRHIAGDLDLTPRQIGNLIANLREMETDITIEPWGYANATTWRVTPAE